MCEFGFRPNKKLGQNFIIDRNIVKKIIDIADIGKADTVLELGAGLGNVTDDIAAVAGKVIAVEFDKKLCEVLNDRFGAAKNIELICRDILKLDLGSVGKKARVKIVGNIPYYITTPILERIIDNRAHISDALLMVQKEYGERMSAKAGSDAYGSISCYLAFYAKTEFKYTVKRSSFYPQPEVDSVLVHVKMLDKPPVDVKNEELLFTIIRSSFNQRRKMLSTSLANKNISGLGKKEIAVLLGRAGVSPDRRPESVSLEEFARITNEFPG